MAKNADYITSLSGGGAVNQLHALKQQFNNPKSKISLYTCGGFNHSCNNWYSCSTDYTDVSAEFPARCMGYSIRSIPKKT